jgi:hypothetical protein
MYKNNNIGQIMNTDARQQKIYVDIEEEITTVVEHLRHVRSSQVVLVVPQHAVLLQSMVNLKLLAQEAKKMQKTITLMTQDVDGIAFAQRAGIITQPYMADEEEQQQDTGMHMQQHVQSRNNAVAPPVQRAQQTAQHTQRPHRATALHNKNNVSGVRQNGGMQQNAVYREQIVQQHAPAKRRDGSGQDNFAHYERSLEKARASKMVQSTQQSQQFQQSAQRTMGTSAYPTQQKHSFAPHATIQEHATREQFSPQNNTRKTKNTKRTAQVPRRANFALKSFVFAGLALIAVVLLVMILPKTHVSVTPKSIDIDENIELTARSDQSVYDADRRLIPARFVERDITFTKTFPATGSGDVDAQKAQGTVTIYNNYSDKPQPLVATTRFLTEDGVLFRLVKGTTVPGMKDGEPGEVDALVIADREGVEGNIGPSRFSIPGLDDIAERKGKFYAVSEKVMAGGGAGGNAVALVTQDDIDAAEKIMKDELDTYVEEQLKAVLRPESEVLLPEAMTADIVRSEASVSEGTMGENFMYEVVSHVTAVVFAQGDVTAVLQEGIDDDMQQHDIDQMALSLTYNVGEADFEDESLKMTVHGKANIDAIVDIDTFKKDIVGKKHDELLAIMEEDYGSMIERITIENVVPAFPGFIANRISRLGFMTTVTVEE